MASKQRTDTQLSKTLSWLLRHGAKTEGVTIRADGFVSVPDLQKHPRYKSFTLEKLKEIAAVDAKQRYTLRWNAELQVHEIRANQGHSMAVVEGEAGGLERITHVGQIPLAVHGTYYRYWEAISNQGLSRMNRNHVHFACSDETNGTLSGFRSDCQILIYLNVEKVLAAEMPAPASEVTSPPGDGDDNLVLCMVCAAPFQSMQDCLAHELLKHASKPQKQLRQRLNAITKIFTSAQTQSERTELQEALENSESGGHLRTVINFFACDLQKMETCFGHVRNCIEKEMRGRVRVFPFGSMVTGLALKESDIDLYLQSYGDQPPLSYKQLYNKVSHFLRRSKCFVDVFTIRHAAVPIIRCKHELTGLNIDINMSNPNSTYNSGFVRELMFRDERLRELGLFLKIWARKLKLIGHGSMTSYCLISMIIVNLQVNRLLPSVKQLQSLCPPVIWSGVNYAYSLDLMPPIPERITTLDLIKNFFVYYCTVNFEKSVLSPFLGDCVDKETTLGTPGGFPEYDEQLKLMHDETGAPPEAFKLDRAMCVQDPFELQRNVAKTVSISNLCFLRQCLVLAAQACGDQQLSSQPEKLYDYLLFGLADRLVADKIVADKRTGSATPRKQQKIENVRVQPPIVGEAQETKVEAGGVYNAPPIVRSHVITPTTNDLKCLRSVVLSSNTEEARPIYYYWLVCYVDTIKDVLTQLYALNVELRESQEPLYYKWLISISYDTWTGRSFQRGAGQSFFAHQLQQTIEFTKTRMGNPQYAVNLRGYFSLQASEDYKELRLDVQPLQGDLLGLQRNSPLTKLFKAFKNLLGNYSFKEKASTWKFCARSDQI